MPECPGIPYTRLILPGVHVAGDVCGDVCLCASMSCHV